jgi:hypothetical protein
LDRVSKRLRTPEILNLFGLSAQSWNAECNGMR